ncbi:MAG: glycosyltransferase family 25 protein [Spongiibacteraceae bacterium]
MTKTNIQIISLNPASADCRRLLNELNQQGLTTEIFSAVDGRHATPAFVGDEVLDLKATLKYRRSALTSSEIGCYLSHLRAIRNAYENGIEKLCLLEDDVRLEPHFAEVLAAAFELPNTIEFIRLMGLKVHRRKLLQPVNDNYALTRPLKGLCGTQGYIINRCGMIKVLEFGKTISEPIDKLYDHFWKMDLRTYSIEPHIIWEEASSSSVAKKNTSSSVKKLPDLKSFVAKKRRSLNRYAYLLTHSNEFFPAKKPKQKPGKIRIKNTPPPFL